MAFIRKIEGLIRCLRARSIRALCVFYSCEADMITAAQIKDLREAVSGFEKTKLLKGKLAGLRQERQPFFLTADEFDEILRWKLDTQYGRRKAHRTKNTDEIVRAVTGLALNIIHEDEDYELELRIDILSSLRGVATPVSVSCCLPSFIQKSMRSLTSEIGGRYLAKGRTHFPLAITNGI